ncbi:MAG: BamA/TamA family outer membrane protein [Edaphocola sp.]
MPMRVPLFVLLLLHFLPMDTVGQKVQLRWQYVDNNQVTNEFFDNKMAALQGVQQKLHNDREMGYLAASVDSVSLGDSIVNVSYFRGAPYRWAKLNMDNVPMALLTEAGIAANDWQNVALSPKRLNALFERLLGHCENNGYPFAQVRLAQIAMQQEGMKATLVLDRGRLMRIDSVLVNGDVDIAPDFLMNYIGIHHGDAYNESLLMQLSKKLANLSFVQEERPWEVDFTIGKNKLHLYLKEKKANQLNGLIGLQPNTVETGKFMLTADALLSLKNALAMGEDISATYQNLQYKSPRFHISAGIPYLMGTNFGVEGYFDLFKKDTTFYRTTFDLGAKYLLNASDYVKISYQNYSNRLITADTLYVIENKALPDNVDVKTNGAVAEFYIDKTDYRLSPRSGWQAKCSGAALVRNVRVNDAIVNISDGSGYDYADLYDTVNNGRYQYKVNAAVAWYIKAAKGLVLKLAYSGGYIYSHSLFHNELYQIGGFKLLRGFDEQSIYANQYHVATAELRLLLGRDSYFCLFGDNAMITTNYSTSKHTDYPVSLGAGITLDNKSGVFNIALGLGKFSGEPFQFSQVKIHFGYAAYF